MPRLLLNVPPRRQEQRSDCLPACVAMALDYLGRPMLYRRLLSLLGARDFGMPAGNILRLNESGIGVYTTLTHSNLDDVRSHLLADRPVIALISTADLPYGSENADHALVIVGMDDNIIYVNDPCFDQSPQSVSRSHFELAWLRFDNMCAVLKTSPWQ